MKTLNVKQMESLVAGDLQDCYHRGRVVGWMLLIGTATLFKGGTALYAGAGVIVGSSGHCFK